MIVGRLCETAESSDQHVLVKGPSTLKAFEDSEARLKRTGLSRLNAGRSLRIPMGRLAGCSIRNTGSSNTLAMKYRHNSGLLRARRPGGCKVARVPSS